jgi:hypothetical protein
MHLHGNARLTLSQRKEVRRLHVEEKISIRALAQMFRVSPKTIQHWATQEVALDKSSAPRSHYTVVTPAFREAILTYRQEHPRHGPIRITEALRGEFPQAKRGNIQRLLAAERLTAKQSRTKRPRRPIPVGRHRIQMDVQTVAAIKGEKGHEYKITMIHLASRVKYSEIHPDHRSVTLVKVFERALKELPLFS